MCRWTFGLRDADDSGGSDPEHALAQAKQRGKLRNAIGQRQVVAEQQELEPTFS